MSRQPVFTEIMRLDHRPITANEVFCVTTGNIRVIGDDNQEKAHLTGNSRGSVICWYGSQQAKATELSGSSYFALFTGLDTNKPAVSRVAEFWAQYWGNRMIRDVDGCGSTPCEAADVVLVSPNGNLQQFSISK
jgi:hypothetical protein